MIYYSEMLSRKNITLAFPVVAKRLLITTHLVMSKENGNVPGVSMSRFNLTSKTSYQINKILKIGMSILPTDARITHL